MTNFSCVSADENVMFRLLRGLTDGKEIEGRRCMRVNDGKMLGLEGLYEKHNE